MKEIKNFYDSNGYFFPINAVDNFKVDKAADKLINLSKNPPKNIPLNIPFNQPTQAMPDDVKNEDSIIAYRDYYIKYKKDFATWKTSIPEWYSEGINANI